MKRALAILALLLAAALPAQPPAMEVAVLETSLGTMVVQLFEKDAPQTVANFRKLVQEGFYSNRTDFIRAAIRNQLTAERDALAQSVERHMLELGLREISRAELETARRAGETLHVKVVGLSMHGAELGQHAVARGLLHQLLDAAPAPLGGGGTPPGGPGPSVVSLWPDGTGAGFGAPRR